MTVYGKEDDLVLALKEANFALANNKRFSLIAETCGDMAAAYRVTQIADVYVAWLRKIKKATLTLVAIEEIDTGDIASTPEGSTSVTTNIDTSQQARYNVTAKDDRDFASDYALDARSSDETVVTVEYFQVGDEGNTTNGTDEELDQVLAKFAGATGTATVEVFDPANPDVVLAADVVVANPGGIAAVELSVASVEEIEDAPEPEPTPEPQPVEDENPVNG